MGNTITEECAVGCIKDGAPWIKSMVVILPSRTVTGKDTTIIGPRKEAIDTMCSLITRGDQWTDYIDMLLARLTLRVWPNNNNIMTFERADAYPYQVADMFLPLD